MADTAERVRSPRRSDRRNTDGAALFVVVREDKGATDVRFVGALTDHTAGRLPDVIRQVMRRLPSFLHLDLRDVDAIDEGGVRRLAHGVRICRRHGGMVKISSNALVQSAIEEMGAAASLGIVPRGVREQLDAVDGDGDGRPRKQAPRY
jgi:anti-anti-sigma regulatory factor